MKGIPAKMSPERNLKNEDDKRQLVGSNDLKCHSREYAYSWERMVCKQGAQDMEEKRGIEAIVHC